MNPSVCLMGDYGGFKKEAKVSNRMKLIKWGAEFH